MGPDFREAVEAGASRNPERILPFLTSSDADVRSYAWRSMAFAWSSPELGETTGLEELVDMAIASGSPDAWNALARIPMEDALRREMVGKVRAAITSGRLAEWQPDQRARPMSGTQQARGDDTAAQQASLTDAACQFIAIQGTIEDARWLMDHVGAAGFDRSPRCALAVGMLASASEASAEDLLGIADLMGSVGGMEAAKGLAYAFSRVARHRPEPGDRLHLALRQAWRDRLGVGVDPELDAWMVRSLGPSSLEILWIHLQEIGIASETVRAMEMARAARDLAPGSLSDTHLVVVSALLEHPNPSVAVMLVDGFSGRKIPDAVQRLFEDRLNGDGSLSGEAPSRGGASSLANASSRGGDPRPAVHPEPTVMDPELRVALMQALAHSMEPDPRRDWLKSKLPDLALVADSNPYLTARLAPLYAAVETPGETIERLERWFQEGGLKASDAIMSLSSVSSDSARVRGMVRLALERGDRGPAIQTEPLLMDELMFPPSEEFNRWLSNLILQTYRLPDDIEVYQMAERALSTRGGAGPIQEAMHRHDVETAAGEGLAFRMPSWERLERLGTHPKLILETEKGRIVVRLETLTAPFTVSAIDALVSEGAYDGVPFHRVVANFVIQGGDVESADGFGGPGFTIPTEISSRSFRRGRFGIASAGPDTEGSQYFIMHAWAPHLDGRYSSLGDVVEGIEVVDAIQLGDRVVRASMEAGM